MLNFMIIRCYLALINKLIFHAYFKILKCKYLIDNIVIDL